MPWKSVSNEMWMTPLALPAVSSFPLMKLPFSSLPDVSSKSNDRSGWTGVFPLVVSVAESVAGGEQLALKPKTAFVKHCAPGVPAMSKQMPNPLFVNPQ